MSTALVLLNRLLAKARYDQVTTIATDDLTTAMMSELNHALRIVLEERTWNFQVRSDGELLLRPSYVETTGTCNTIGANITINASDVSPVSADLAGAFKTSFVFTGSSAYSDTTFDLVACRLSGATSLSGTLAFSPSTAITSTGWSIFIYQYALPDTVRQVLEIWHQEEDMEIYQEDEHDFRRLVPRPYDQYGEQPRVAFLGGTLTSTVTNSSLLTGTEYNAIRIWPVPGTEEILHYRYVKRQGDLSAATDTVDGVPLSVEDLVVQLAYARQLQSIQKDPQRGFEMESRVLAEVDRKHRNHKVDPQRGRTMRSLDAIGRRPTELLRSHTTVPGWP